MPRTPLRVLLSDERGRSIPSSVAGGLSKWLQRVAPPAVRGIVSVALVSDAQVRALNRKFRRKNAVTDVLSFPANGTGRIGGKGGIGGTGRMVRKKGRPVQPVPPFLGDIVIARAVALRQARDAGHTLNAELRVLALHGLLHLLGYDHEHDDGRMRRIEARLRRKGGLREGLIERTRDSA